MFSGLTLTNYKNNNNNFFASMLTQTKMEIFEKFFVNVNGLVMNYQNQTRTSHLVRNFIGTLIQLAHVSILFNFNCNYYL